MTGCIDCPNGALHERVGMLEQQGARTTAVLENLNANMAELVAIGKQQVRLEERQIEQGKAIERAFEAVHDEAEEREHHDGLLDGRLKKLEGEAPRQKIAADWIFEAMKWLAVLGFGLLAGQQLL